LFFAFQDILKNRENSRYARWYNIKKWNAKNKDGFDYVGWFGHKSLPEFYRDENGMNPEYADYVFNITKRWMSPAGNSENGIDGWRLDVAFCVPHSFWKQWRRCVKAINPNAYITAEVIEIAPEFLQGDEFDALMNYPFATAAIEFFVDKKNRVTAVEFDKRLKQLRDSYSQPVNYVMQNLFSSHDTARLRSLIVNPDLNYRDWGGYFNNSKIENNKNFRIDRGGEEDIATHKLMTIFQMTYLGAPMIYYGDEVGMTGANDPDCRKPMLWEEFHYADETIHPHKDRTRPAEKNSVDKELLNHYKKLIAIRKNSVALLRGDFETLITDNTKEIYGFKRKFQSESVIVILNNSNIEQNIEFDIPESNVELIIDELNNIRYNLKNKEFNIIIKPKWASILKYSITR